MNRDADKNKKPANGQFTGFCTFDGKICVPEGNITLKNPRKSRQTKLLITAIYVVFDKP